MSGSLTNRLSWYCTTCLYWSLRDYWTKQVKIRYKGKVLFMNFALRVVSWLHTTKSIFLNFTST